jgi:phosphoserine phosphatase
MSGDMVCTGIFSTCYHRALTFCTTCFTGMKAKALLVWPQQVLPPGCSKGSGLAWLLDHLGVPPGAVMALGDGENDVEMLQAVGVSTLHWSGHGHRM